MKVLVYPQLCDSYSQEKRHSKMSLVANLNYPVCDIDENYFCTLPHPVRKYIAGYDCRTVTIEILQAAITVWAAVATLDLGIYGNSLRKLGYGIIMYG